MSDGKQFASPTIWLGGTPERMFGEDVLNFMQALVWRSCRLVLGHQVPESRQESQALRF